MKNDALRAAQESLRAAQLTTKKIEAREEVEEHPKKSGSSLLEAVRFITLPVRRIGKVWDAAQDLYEKVSPYAKKILTPARWVGGKLMDAFSWAAYEREDGKQKLDADGDRIFSAGRLCRMFTLAVGLGVASIGAVNTVYYQTTQFTQTIYTTGKQEIVPGQTYQFTGCTSLPCSTDSGNGEYYQIQKSWYSPFLIFPEEDVYANIPNEMAVCEVTGYGFHWKGMPFYHTLDLYQNVTNVSCRPLTQEEIHQSMKPAEQAAVKAAQESPANPSEQQPTYAVDRPVVLRVEFPTGPLFA